jgi:murein DD-endopeptidase MepM/ murein hydrolase activator NlpD
MEDPVQMIRVLLPFFALLLFLVPSQLEARTLPRRGAAVKPRRFKIRAPFPCGVKVRISCGYGPRAGSRAHRRIRYTHSTNDYYALDMMRLEANNGFDKPVVAVASGRVLYAGWARRGWAPYGKIVYIQHDFKDSRGRRYQTLYAHLNRVKVRRGARVRAGTTIGTLGGSSRRRLRKYGPHLHFAMYRGASRWLGGGRAVVPEPMGKHEDLRRRMEFEACGEPAERIVLRPLPEDLTAVGGLLD